MIFPKKKPYLSYVNLLSDFTMTMAIFCMAKERHWYNELTFFYKIVNGLLPNYLQSYIEASFQDNCPL